MPEEIKAPYYSYEDLRREADKFLGEYHPAGTIPVPIEQIVEFQFRVDIVPTPGLHQLLERDGFITSDLREIWVDQFVYDTLPDASSLKPPEFIARSEAFVPLFPNAPAGLRRPIFHGDSRNGCQVTIGGDNDTVSKAEGDSCDLNVDLLHRSTDPPKLGKNTSKMGCGFTGIRPNYQS